MIRHRRRDVSFPALDVPVPGGGTLPVGLAAALDLAGLRKVLPFGEPAAPEKPL